MPVWEELRSWVLSLDGFQLLNIWKEGSVWTWTMWSVCSVPGSKQRIGRQRSTTLLPNGGRKELRSWKIEMNPLKRRTFPKRQRSVTICKKSREKSKNKEIKKLPREIWMVWVRDVWSSMPVFLSTWVFGMLFSSYIKYSKDVIEGSPNQLNGEVDQVLSLSDPATSLWARRTRRKSLLLWARTTSRRSSPTSKTKIRVKKRLRQSYAKYPCYLFPNLSITINLSRKSSAKSWISPPCQAE